MNTKSKAASAKGNRVSRQASSASGRRLRAQGQRTRELIIQEAKKLLLEGGSLEFTLRTVARRAQISISNLQYYFPTRASVLRAIMEPVIARYMTELDSALDDATDPSDIMSALINQTLADVRDPEVSAIWLHFASLAVTDPESASLLDESYEKLTRGIGQLLRRLNPSLGTKDSHILARIVAAMIDGLVFQIGAGHRTDYSVSAIEQRLRAAVMLLVAQLPHANSGTG